MKTVDWSKLPNEILLNIFQRNDNNTNSQCSLTCHDWTYTARCILFEKIPMTEKKMDVMSKALSICQDNCTGFDQSLRNYVKIVNYQIMGEMIDWELLNKMFPYLEVIKSNYFYLGASTYDQVYRLLEEGKFPHLKELPHGYRKNPPLKLLLDRGERIEELVLCDISGEDKILQNMHLFPNLKKLDLRYESNMHLENVFLKDMPNLKSIDIESILYSKNTLRLNIDKIRPYPNIRKMEIFYRYFSYYDDKYFIYIMKKFPNLETLKMDNGSRSCFFHGIDYAFVTIDCLFQFLVYLTKMKRYSYAGYMMANNFTTQLVKKFLSYLIDQRTVYYKKMNINLDVSFNVFDPEDEYVYRPDDAECIAIENQKAGYDGYKENRCILFIMYDTLEGTTNQSHLQLFREVGNMNITSLRIGRDIESEEYANIKLNVFRTIIPIELDVIFSYFSKLEHLEISEAFNFI